MKNLLIILVSLFFFTTSFSQSIEYPKFEIDSLGQKVVVMTIEQAQALDNSTDLIPLFEKMNTQVGSVDSACIKVVNEKDIVIAKQNIQISDQKSLLLVKDREIANLHYQIDDYKAKELLYKREIENKDAEINLHLDKIKDQKVKMWLGGSIGGLVIVGLVVAIIATN